MAPSPDSNSPSSDSNSPSSDSPSDSNSPSPPPPDSSPPPPPPNSSDDNSPPPPANSDDNKSPPPPDKQSPPPPKNKSASSGSSSPPPPPPPPPPPSSRGSRGSPPLAPPPPGGSTNDSSSSSSSSNNKGTIIAGAAIGAGLLLLVLVAIVVACARKRKRKPHDNMHYYSDNSPKGAAGQNYSGQHGQWHSSPHYGQDMNSGMHSTGMNSSGMQPPGWPMPPPPPPAMNSAQMSTGQYSSGPQGPALPPPHPSIALGFNKSTFTYDELAAATSGFSQGNLLGQGGFGFVHKGVLPNGKEIAVKSLKSGSGQGEREFQAEVEIISRVHHRHLVSLVGYCIAGGQRMLVYEFIPNNTLEFHLHGKGQPTMDFPTRLKIALGSAKGLAYLHEDCHPRIIHRDIKAANILIDNGFEAKVADFGLAKLSQDNYTHVSTRVMGTFGYLAPEYAASGKLTEKSDVFSFGVMLMELITGKRPVDPSGDEDSLVDWARPLLTHALDELNFNGLADPRLENNFNSQEMARMVACAASSIRHSAKRRPKMSQIVRALEGDVSLDDLNDMKPGNSSAFGSGSGSSDYDSSTYNSDMQKLRGRGLNSQEYPSSEYGGSASTSSGESPGAMKNMGRSRPGP
ncbi:hypothetical protein Ancab_018118 [Ancistrocladus abbreviatus]